MTGGPGITDLGHVRFAVVDLETSGLRPSRHHVVQMAVVTVDAEGRRLDEWVTYVRPPHWPVARVGPRHIHGVTRAMVRRAPSVAHALGELAERIDGAVLTAHNMEFDFAFLERDARRHGIALPPTPQLCTLLLSRSLDPERQRSHRLGDVCQRYGIPVDRPHDALADAAATGAALAHLLREAGINTWDQLVAAPGMTS